MSRPFLVVVQFFGKAAGLRLLSDNDMRIAITPRGGVQLRTSRLPSGTCRCCTRSRRAGLTDVARGPARQAGPTDRDDASGASGAEFGPVFAKPQAVFWGIPAKPSAAVLEFFAFLTHFHGRDIISFAAWDRRLRGAGRQMDLSMRRQVTREMEFALMPMRELTVATGSFDSKERVKQAIDIVDLVGSHIQLRRQGRNYVGLCPWHDDSRPSLQVNPERQSFKCWVCDIGGDVFSFVMKMEGVEFREALEMLADRAGIVIERPRRGHFAVPREAASGSEGEYGEYAEGQPEATFVPPTNAENKRTLLQAMAWAVGQYHQCLLNAPEADAARRYLQERGITAESIEQFQLGFSPLERDWILRSVKEKGKGKRRNVGRRF